MLKALTILFLVMSAIAGAALYSNIVGNYFDGDQGASFIYYMVIANQDQFDQGSLTIGDALSHLNDRDIYKQIVIFSDLLYCLAFFLFLNFMRFRTKRETKDFQVDNVLMSDYSIEVRGFPSSALSLTQDVFKSHF